MSMNSVDHASYASPWGRVALITAAPEPDLYTDPDLPLLQEALTSVGIEADVVLWDDRAVDWGSYDVAVVRSTWDYISRADAFNAWIDRCSTETCLLNPPSVLRWNTDKRYLADLASAGVRTVPTRFLPPGSAIGSLPRQEYVIKPTTGNAARLAARYQPDENDTASKHLEAIHGKGLTAMIQPYMKRIDTSGEHSLVFIAGRFLHAAAKRAVLAPSTAFDARKTTHPGLSSYTPTSRELTAAHRALAAVPGDPELLYARVDLVEDDMGEPCVMELELVEPDLFLSVQEETQQARSAAMIACMIVVALVRSAEDGSNKLRTSTTSMKIAEASLL